jgi:phosphoribosyl-dephospho-CoA transferase
MTMPHSVVRHVDRIPEAGCLRRWQPSDLPRHTLVWLKRGSAWTALSGSPSWLLDEWFRAYRPAVIARRQGDEPAGWLRLGVPLPPARGKQRLSLAVHPLSVEEVRAPLALTDVIGCCPPEWMAPLQSLRAMARDVGLTPGVYGSFAWQALTGERYVGPGSDIDLVWHPQDATQLAALLGMLARWEESAQRRADGEIVLPNGDAVCWRELAGESSRLLVKSALAVALHRRSDVLAQFG